MSYDTRTKKTKQKQDFKNAFQSGNYTFTVDAARASEAIIRPAFEDMDLGGLHNVVPNIKADKQVAILSILEKITKLNGGAGTGATQLTSFLNVDEIRWNPVRAKVWLQESSDALQDTFFVWGLKNGIEESDLSQTDFEEFWLMRLSEAVPRDATRIAWFADTAIASPPLTISGDIANYNLVDGFWKLIFAQATANPLQRYTIAENALATKSAQLNLPVDAAKNAFEALVSDTAGVSLDSRVYGDPNAIILCTSSLFRNYRNYLSNVSGVEASFNILQNGQRELSYQGVRIVEVQQWDDIIRRDFDNGTTFDNPHRAVYINPENLLVGVDYTDFTSLGGFEFFYDKTTEFYNSKGGYKLDIKLPLPDLLGVAF